MKTLLIITTLLIAMQSHSQTYYFVEGNKLSGTHYKYPATVLGAGYKIKFMTAEGGIRTNWQEYYTFAYTGIGFEYKRKLLLQGNVGAGLMFTLPMQDRYYNPQTHEITVLSEGYTTKTIGLGYYGGRAGWRIFHVGSDSGVWLFGSYNMTGKFAWKGIGILLTQNK